MAEITAETYPEPVANTGLSRTINLAQVTWMTIAWLAVLLVGAALRLFQLGLATLSPPESMKSWQAWALVYGNTEGAHNGLSRTQPTGLLLRALSFFLFGATDTSARIPSALMGIGLIVMIWSVRDLIGEWRAIVAAGLVAISPTAILASRTINEEIAALFFGFLFLITFFRIAQSDRVPGTGRAVILGFSLAALIGSGPSAISLLLVLIVTLGLAPFVSLDRGATISRGLRRIMDDRQLLLGGLLSLALSLIIIFTRFFTDPGAIRGLGNVFGDWGKLIANSPGTISTQFFILAALLYEFLAVVFAIKIAFGVASSATGRTFDWSYPAIWFLASLILFSFSSGRQPEQTILVVFPLLLLGGFGLGDTLEDLFATANRTNRMGLLVLLVIGLILALLAVLVLIGRVDSAIDRNDAASSRPIASRLRTMESVLKGPCLLAMGFNPWWLMPMLPLHLTRRDYPV